jgi:hypothetical protein
MAKSKSRKAQNSQNKGRALQVGVDLRLRQMSGAKQIDACDYKNSKIYRRNSCQLKTFMLRAGSVDS